MNEHDLFDTECEAARLLQVSGCFTFLMDQEQILIAVLREVSDTDVDRCVISVFEDVQDRDPEWLERVAAYDRASGELGLESVPCRFSMDEMPIVQKLLREKEPITLRDLDHGTKINGLARERLWLQDMAGAAIVPFVVMGWPIGMLIVSRRKPDPFSASDLRFYQIVANLAAMALRAVHLIESQRQYMAEQNAVNRVGKAVSSVIRLNKLLQEVYDQINTVMDAQNFYIALYDPFHNETSFSFAIEKGVRQQWPDQRADQGLTGYVLQTRQPLLLADQLEKRMEKLGIEQIGDKSCTWMGAPMIIGDKITGVMAVQNFEKERAYTPANLDLLAALANQVAIAIENARLYEEVRRQAVYSRLSAEVGRRIVLILDIDELLSQVVELVRRSFGYYHVHVALVDKMTGTIEYKVGSSEPRVSLPQQLPQLEVGREGIIGWVAGHGEPLLVNDVHNDPRYFHMEALPDTRSELAVPIKFGSKILGVLNIESDQRNAFHPSDIPIMYTVADQIAVSLENARLFNEQQRRIQELDVLVNIGQALCKVTNRSKLLHLVYTQLSKLIDVSNFFVALYNPQEQTIHIQLAYEDDKPLSPFTLHYDAKEGLTSWVIENRQPLLIQDWYKDDRGLGERVVEKGTLDTHSWLGVPILRCDQVLGVIGVQNTEPNAFDERHQTILTTVAAQLAMALSGQLT